MKNDSSLSHYYISSPALCIKMARWKTTMSPYGYYGIEEIKKQCTLHALGIKLNWMQENGDLEGGKVPLG